MFKPGSIVYQKETIVNGTIEENYTDRLSFVLFSTKLDEQEFVATCPITSTWRTVQRSPRDYCVAPYLVCGKEKHGFVRIKDLTLYEASTVIPTGLIASEVVVERVQSAIRQLATTEVDFALYNFVISEFDQLDQRMKADSKEEKRLRKKQRVEARRIAKRSEH